MLYTTHYSFTYQPANQIIIQILIMKIIDTNYLFQAYAQVHTNVYYRKQNKDNVSSLPSFVHFPFPASNSFHLLLCN